MKELWNERYAEKDYAYGKEPNKFFRQELSKLNPGKILLPGDGEGRNGVFAASSGWNVDIIDFSEEGKRKALLLADEFNVSVNYIIDDLNTVSLQSEYYDAAALIFVHINENDRESFHKKIINSLKPGGRIIIELYEKDQLKRNSGAPKDETLLYSLEEIITDFKDFDIIHFSKEIVELNEGKYHNGESVVIRFVGVKNNT